MKIGYLLAGSLLAANLACSPKPIKTVESSDTETKVLSIRAFRVADSDCSNLSSASTEIAKRHFDNANRVFAESKVGIQFKFDSDLGLITICNSEINQTEYALDKDGSVTPNPRAQKLANHFSDEVVVFFGQERRIGYSWGSLNYISMPGPDNFETKPALFAHELGHYLGLSHTFPQEVNGEDKKFIENYIKTHPSGLDGDGLSDTPSEAGELFYYKNKWKECTSEHSSYVIAGKTFTPDRTNFMSYFDCGKYTVSPQQISVMHRTLAEHPHRKNLL